MGRVNYIPKDEHFISDWQGGGFPVFKSQRFPLRGRGFGGGAISHFFSNTILPFVRKRIVPLALKTAKKVVKDVIVKKIPPKQVLKHRLGQASKRAIAQAISPGERKRRKTLKKKSEREDIFSNM